MYEIVKVSLNSEQLIVDSVLHSINPFRIHLNTADLKRHKKKIQTVINSVNQSEIQKLKNFDLSSSDIISVPENLQSGES